jgi:hypothetical protein
MKGTFVGILIGVVVFVSSLLVVTKVVENTVIKMVKVEALK